jgi:hypothetical protein
MQQYLFAKNNYENNYDLLLDFSIYEILFNSKYSKNPNVGLIKKDQVSYFKTLKPIKKGEALTINFKSNNNLNFQKGGFSKNSIKSELNNFFTICKKLTLFIENKNFKSNDIRELKKEVNVNNYFQINNEMIYKTAKEIKKYKSNIMKGGGMNDQDGMTNNVEVLPNVERGSFIHHSQSITFTQKIDKLHLLLDLIGLVPTYGIAADVVNFLLYFVRGEYSDAFYSLICMIPTVGSILGLTTKYLVKFFNNRKPEYQEYYNSMQSLKDITKELRIVENKHRNLDNFAYKDNDEEFEP